MHVSVTAGLGALFVPLANKHTKPGGRIAFILPLALASGESWSSVRGIISQHFHLETVIVSHDPERPNFSENTALSEILFIARKLKEKEKTGLTSYVNLWHNPRSIHEALDLATRVTSGINQLKASQEKSSIVMGPSAAVGEVTNLPSPVDSENWTGALFAQSLLMSIYLSLNKESTLRVPGNRDATSLPLCKLSDLGTLGYDVRDIADAFGVDKEQSQWSHYPAFWNHDSKRVVCILQEPNAYLLKRSEPLPGRKLKDATSVWSRAGNILLVSRLRTNTHRVVATGFDKKVLGNTWWGFDDSNLSVEQRKALLLWLNSTLSILLYFGRRVITEGAWMQMKKPAWSSMPVLNVQCLSSKKLKSLSQAYDDLATQELMPISNLDCDETRRAFDMAICDTLKLSDLSGIRELLSREPGLSTSELNFGETTYPVNPSKVLDDLERDLDMVADKPLPKKKRRRKHD